jgi:hypothetical protein
MTEIEYLRATNRTKVSMALTIMRDVLPGAGDEYGISGEEKYEIMRLLSLAESKLFSSYEIKETNQQS